MVLPPKALFALAAVVIAGTFVALMIKSRGPVAEDRHEPDELDTYAAEQTRISADHACRDSVGHAVVAAGEFLTSRYGDGAPEGIRELAVHRCTFDEWPSEVVACLGMVTSDNELQRCIGKLPEHQRRALESEMKAFAARPPRPSPDAAVDAEPDDSDDGSWTLNAAPNDPQDPADPAGIPAACLEYEQSMDRLATCDKLPRASRDALRQGFEAMRTSWGQLGSLPKSARDAMETGCRQAVAALKQAGASICGW